MVGRYRALPPEQRERLPALLNAVGKLEVAAGNFESAQKDFTTVAKLVDNQSARAEAHFNAYQAALEHARSSRRWPNCGKRWPSIRPASRRFRWTSTNRCGCWGRAASA